MRRLLKRSLIAAASYIAVVGCVWFLLPKPPLLDGISFSQSVRDRSGNLLRLTPTSDQKFRIWTPLRDISPELIDATLRYEDKYFARHPGLNPIELLPSAMGLLRGETRPAPSTITITLPH